MHSKHNVQNRKHNYTQKHSADTAKKTTQGQSQSSCQSSRWLNAAFCCSIITFTQLLTCRLLQFPPYRHFWFSAPHWTAGGKLELRVEFEELKMKPACVCVHVYLSLYVGDWSSIAVGNSCIGTVGTAGTWPRSTVTERGNWWRDTDTGINEQQIHFKFLIKAAIHTKHSWELICTSSQNENVSVSAHLISLWLSSWRCWWQFRPSCGGEGSSASLPPFASSVNAPSG